MKTKFAAKEALKTHVYHIPRGRNVKVVHQGDTIVVTRRVSAAARKRAFEAILRHMDKQPRRSDGPTATEIIREIRDSGR